jgi:hypothetical protein
VGIAIMMSARRWLTFLFILLFTLTHAHAQAPSIAAAVGYNTNTLSTTSFSRSNVDMGGDTIRAGTSQYYYLNLMDLDRRGRPSGR